MEIIDFIVCDDIRYEIGNKVTLVGVYGEAIVFGEKDISDVKWPKAMRLGIFMRSLFTPEEPFPNKFEIDILYDGEKKLSIPGVIKREVNAAQKEFMISVAVVAGSFPFHGVGPISFKLKYFENDKLIAEATPANKIIVRVSQQAEAIALK